MWVFGLIIALVGCLAIPDNVFAQRRRGGGSRSSGGSSWGSKPKASKPRASKPRPKASKPKPKASKPKASKSKKDNKGWGSSKKAKPSKKQTKTDQAAWDKSKKGGKQFADTPKGRKAATEKFRKNNASKYNSKYDRKPTQRPSHIPSSTSSGGVTYNVTYNQGYGGYGYMGSGGRWMMYDAMADVAMMSMLMRNNGYMFGTRPVYVSSGVGAGTVVLTIFILAGIGGLVIWKVRS